MHVAAVANAHIPRRHTSHLHGLPEGAAVGQAVVVEGTQVTATPVLDDVALSGAPVRAHGGALEGLQGVTGEVRDMQLSAGTCSLARSLSLSVSQFKFNLKRFIGTVNVR